MIEYSEHDVTDNDVEEIQKAAGTYHTAWDMLDPKAIIAACWNHLVNTRREELPR